MDPGTSSAEALCLDLDPGALWTQFPCPGKVFGLCQTIFEPQMFVEF